MIADGDSSCYRTILDKRPYKCVVEKIECRNHLLRNFCSKLVEVGKTKNVTLVLKNVVVKNVLRARTAVIKAIHYRKRQAADETEKIKGLKSDILNSLSHMFGEHAECSKLKYFCTLTSPDDLNYVPDLKT